MGDLKACTVAAIIPAAAGSHSLHVKSGQAPRTANHEGQAEPPAKMGDLLNAGRELKSRKISHAPGVRQQRGSDAKTDYVCPRIELNAELRIRAGQARHPAVERIKQNRQTDGLCGVIERIRLQYRTRQRRDARVVTAQ